MKRALHFATKLNSRDIQKCNCFWVPSYDLLASACKAVFPAPTATEKQQSFLNQNFPPPPPPPPIKIPGSAPVTDITSLTFIDNKSHYVPSCKQSLLLSISVRRTKGGIFKPSLLLTNPGFKTVSSNMSPMPNKGIIMQSLFRVRQTSDYEVLFLNIEFHILFIAQFFSLIPCWACTRHYVPTKHSDHYTFLGTWPSTLP